MTDRKEDRKLTYYVCGWCRDKIHYPITDDKPIPCPNCGWNHSDQYLYNKVPPEIRVDLSNPTIS